MRCRSFLLPRNGFSAEKKVFDCTALGGTNGRPCAQNSSFPSSILHNFPCARIQFASPQHNFPFTYLLPFVTPSTLYHPHFTFTSSRSTSSSSQCIHSFGRIVAGAIAQVSHYLFIRRTSSIFLSVDGIKSKATPRRPSLQERIRWMPGYGRVFPGACLFNLYRNILSTKQGRL